MNLVRRLSAALAATAATVTVGLGGAPAASAAGAPLASGLSAVAAPTSSCALGNGVSHVIQITFDNVHFFRDNPNVPSDLEQIPALTNFIESNGTMLSNNHTPLIAHTANDSLTNYTGIYGDRHGVGISNSYQSYNKPNGTATNSDTDGAFTYWTDKINDTNNPPSAGADLANPNEVYSANVPATSTPPTATPPAPWVPYTRAGCDVGDFSTANMVLENPTDIPQVFGAGSPEAAQTTADASSFKDLETAQYIGISAHCASGSTLCTNATGVKYGQTTATGTAVTDVLPNEPGGYNGFQALHGNRYLAPQIAAGAVNNTTSSGGFHVDGANSYQVTNAAGNLVDLNGAEIDNFFAGNKPGFPGFSPTAAQSLAYLADMQEANIPVTYGYISDLHEKKPGQTGCTSPGSATGPGDPCYEATAAAYNQAFTTFFQRLANDGITPANSLFIFTADEGDHFAGANASRAAQPTCTSGGPAGITCSYTKVQDGELQTDLPKLLQLEKNDTATFNFEPQAGAVYAYGQPGPNDPTVRQLERDSGAITANNPYSGNAAEPVANYLADPTEEQILHYVNADPARTPTFTLFPKPDYYFTGGTNCTDATTTNTTGSCVTINNKFAWNHGYYAPEINTTWLGLAGPGVANKGLDGNSAASGVGSAGANSGNGTIPGDGLSGTWVDHTDIRPTTLALVGLTDDYQSDGRVITEDLTNAGTAKPVTAAAGDPSYVPLAACYKQLNSSVGQFGTDTLQADTAAVESGSGAGTGDANYQSFQTTLGTLGSQRDALATEIKGDLTAAAFSNTPLPNASGELSSCNQVLASAASLPGVGPIPQTPEVPAAVLLPVSALALIAGVALFGARRRRRSLATAI